MPRSSRAAWASLGSESVYRTMNGYSVPTFRREYSRVKMPARYSVFVKIEAHTRKVFGNCQRKRTIADSLDCTFCGVCDAITFRNRGHGVVYLLVFAGPDELLARFNVIIWERGVNHTTVCRTMVLPGSLASLVSFLEKQVHMYAIATNKSKKTIIIIHNHPSLEI